MKKRTSTLSGLLVTTILYVSVSLSDAQCTCQGEIEAQGIFGDNAGTKWSSAALQILEDANTPDTTIDVPPIARILAVFSSCMYDTYCVVKEDCIPILFDQAEQAGIQTPTTDELTGGAEIQTDEVETQVSYAAFYALENLFGRQYDQAIDLLEKEGLEVSDVNSSIGANVCKQVLSIRSNDGSAESGDFEPSNAESTIPNNAECRAVTNKGTWQPLCIPDEEPGVRPPTFVQLGGPIAAGDIAEGTNTTDVDEPPSPSCNPQEFPSPQYADQVLPFDASTREAADTLEAPPQFGTTLFNDEFDEVLEYSGSIDDYKKTVSEYWDDNPYKTFPPGQFYRMSLEAAVANKLELKNTVALQMTMGNAMLDAAIAAWATKKTYDLVRPITVLQCQKQNQTIKAWRMPYLGVTEFRQTIGRRMQPYLDTPPFPGYVSGHSTFGGAGEAVLISWFGSDYVGPNCWTRNAGESKTEPKRLEGTPGFMAGLTDVPNSGPMTKGYSPAKPVELCWNTWREASDENGISRLYGGVHINADNIFGTSLGRLVGSNVDKKARTFTNIEGAGGESM